MTDGVLDLLTAILVLGVVVAICFGFILPLTDSQYMGYDSQYEDKGAMNALLDNGMIDTNDSTITRRMYTYEEMLLLLSVQDARMESPKVINIRNLMTSSDMSYSGYNTAKYPGSGKTNALTDINDALRNENGMTFDTTDEAQRAILRYAENPVDTGGSGENSPIMGTLGSQTEPNIGALVISDTFKLTKDYVITELNGAEWTNAQYNGEATNDKYFDTFRLADRRSNIIKYDKTYGSAITKPDPDLDNDVINENRIYYISHHFTVADDSNYMTDAYKRSDDEQAAFFVEIQGPFLREGVIKEVDTYAEYQEYLRLYRATIIGNKK